MSLDQIKKQIESSHEQAGLTSGSTTIIAVSKLQPMDRVRSVLKMGHRVFGENRVQEAAEKWPSLIEQYPDVNLHMLGPLQSNKARQAMELFQAIHSMDRLSLVNRIARIADELGSCPQLFIQVNTGEEPQKSGIFPDDTDNLVKEVQKFGLPLEGLMCIPPVHETPALHFGLLATLAKRNGLKGLSMGMSGDFEVAVKLGATHIRVGTAIFGLRPENH